MSREFIKNILAVWKMHSCAVVWVWFQFDAAADGDGSYPGVIPGDGAVSLSGKRPCRVLIIEDELDIRRVMGWLLESEGYVVDQAGQGREAIEQLLAQGAQIPDVILLDLLMPIMSGEEFLSWLRETSPHALRTIPVVVTTGVSEVPPGVLKSARVVLKKPVDAERLMRAIQQTQESRHPTGESKKDEPLSA